MIESLPRGPFENLDAATNAVSEWVNSIGAKLELQESSTTRFNLELPDSICLELRLHTSNERVYIGVTQMPSRPQADEGAVHFTP
jgi:hypothetical protein